MGQPAIYWNSLCDECYYEEDRWDKHYIDSLCDAVRANKEDKPKKKFRYT